jgi:hypothetical protein
VILVTIWLLQKLEKDWQLTNNSKELDVERFNLWELSDQEFRKQYQMKTSNKSAALENLNDSKNINLAWENIIQNNKTSAKDSLDLYELKQHKPMFYE